MPEENWLETLRNAKQQYKEIGHLLCPAFDNEKIYFRNRGFTHLLRKGREPRVMEQQKRRIGLLKYVADILTISTQFHTYRLTKKQIITKKGLINSTAQFWSFRKVIDDTEVFVVVCQFEKEPKQFMSVVDRLPDLEN